MEIKTVGNTMNCFCFHIQDVHSNAADIGLDYINYQKFDKNYTNIFMIIALIVLGDRVYQFYESLHCPVC